MNEYRLLKAFRAVFEGQKYLHRNSSIGDRVAMEFYEDLAAVSRSSKLIAGVQAKERVLNVQNRRHGVKARRGDGTFGEIIPGEKAISDPGYVVARGLIATVDIGTEVKILAKAMIKQIDRVVNDLCGQAEHFRTGGHKPICVAVIGINSAERYTSYEKERFFTTTGRDGYLHPIQEAAAAERHLTARAKPCFDEFLILRFKAANEAPFPFSWLDYSSTSTDYGAILTRVSSKYQQRF